MVTLEQLGYCVTVGFGVKTPRAASLHPELSAVDVHLGVFRAFPWAPVEHLGAIPPPFWITMQHR